MNRKNTLMYVFYFCKLYASSINKHIAAHMFKVCIASIYKLSIFEYPLIYEYMHLKTLIEGDVSAVTVTDEICLMIPKKIL